jgi:hypothetical protein
MIVVEETDLRYYVKESTLPNAGLGLFAKEPLKKGDYLEVMGPVVKKGSVADQCTHYAKRYKFAALNTEFKIVPMGYAGLVNHTDDPAKQNCELTIVPDQPRNPLSSHVCYVFTKDIAVDEEILGNYGENVGKEIKKMNENASYHEECLGQWVRFLKHDCYDLKRLCEML